MWRWTGAQYYGVGYIAVSDPVVAYWRDEFQRHVIQYQVRDVYSVSVPERDSVRLSTDLYYPSQ